MTIQLRARARVSDETPERDLVGTYLHEISATPLLDASAEVELAKAIEAGLYAEQVLEGRKSGQKKSTKNKASDSEKLPKPRKSEAKAKKKVPASESATDSELRLLVAEGRRAKETFIVANLRLVVSIARRYTRSAMPLLDLVQEGNAGLVRAVEKFDYRKGFKFSTYATWWVRQAVTRAIAQQGRVVRLPVHVVEEINRMRGARRELLRELGRDPQQEELAVALDMDIERVRELIDFSREPISLDTPVGENEETALGDLIADSTDTSPEEWAVADAERRRLEELLCNLEERSAHIVRQRFGLADGRQRSLTEIARDMGVSRERVRQIEGAALRKLRVMTGADDDHELAA